MRNNTTWVIPCNDKYYDHKGAFETLDYIDWRQTTNVEVGDEVYIYVGRPYGAILYRCDVIKADLVGDEVDFSDNSYKLEEDDPSQEAGRYMRLVLKETYPADKYKRPDLLEHGLKTVQGPSKATQELLSFLKSYHSIRESSNDIKQIGSHSGRRVITMDETMEYKGYVGSVEFSREDKLFFGKVLGIRATVSYEGVDKRHLLEDFLNAVDDYLSICESEGIKPEKSNIRDLNS